MSDYRIIYDDELMHYGVLGMKWGVRRDKTSFNTNYRPTGLTRPSGFRGERIAYTKGHDRISDRKAERAALREGRSYRRTFKDKANDKDELSVIGNKYHEEATKRETRKADKKEYKKAYELQRKMDAKNTNKKRKPSATAHEDYKKVYSKKSVREMSDVELKRAKAIKVGAAAAGAALATYGAYKISKLPKKLIPFGVEKLKKMGISTFDFETFKYD